MKLQFLEQASGPLPLWLFVLWGLVWIVVLYCILTREDFDPVTKLLWTVVVIFVPFFGVVLYWIAAPASKFPVSGRSINLESDVSGTPWEGEPNFTRPK
jgi:predicted membrane channel-forming protein YqfA (hemolysin III family)